MKLPNYWATTVHECVRVGRGDWGLGMEVGLKEGEGLNFLLRGSKPFLLLSLVNAFSLKRFSTMLLTLLLPFATLPSTLALAIGPFLKSQDRQVAGPKENLSGP